VLWAMDTPSAEYETLIECLLCGSHGIEAIDPDAALSMCSSCGYVFDNPRPTLKAITDFYSRPTKYDAWLAEEHARDKLWRRRLRKMRRTARPGNLLDVGAGIGQFLHLARQYYEEVSGTEVSSSAVRIAKEKYGLELHHGTLETLSFAPESFNNITMFHVLEHVPNPKLLVGRCFSLLREAGVVVIAVPKDFQPWDSRYRDGYRSGRRRIQLEDSTDEIHLSHFTPSVLRHLLEDCGFTVIEESIDPYRVPREGREGFKQDLTYRVALVVLALSRKNVYDSIWMVAKKQEQRRQPPPVG
jgi:ubiquinone/menaquinone biosynthesis C-methylase UbiE